MERIKQLLTSPDPITWLFAGDSITQGALHTYGARDYTQLFSEKVRFELGRGRDAVINTAISGRTSYSVVEDFERTVTHFAPDVLFVMLGMNDAASKADGALELFRHNLRFICRQSQAKGECQVVLQTSCPIIAESSPERGPHLAGYMAVVREVALEEEVALVDHTIYWEEQIAASPLLRYSWMNDPIHPNAEGHRALAQFILNELGI